MQDEAINAYRSLNAWWSEAGVDVESLPKLAKTQNRETGKSDKPIKQPSPSLPPANQISTSKPTTHRLKEAVKLASDANDLEQLYSTIRNFDAGTLSHFATQAVIARGNPKSDVMLIGEAPGIEEDEAGKPFIGPSGQFLDKMFASIELDEKNLYITNSVFWRPKGNRKPTDEEMKMCLPFVHRHIALIAPKILVTTGANSSKNLLGVDTGITRLRGKWGQYTIKNPDGSDSKTTIPVLPMFHPAFVLRKPATKKDCWHDLLSLQETLESFK
ncbi:MAG: uracil-DNA glycosylase [Robiginitomaculum sp.]|nr:uracil-DNA glycosylase [Robiginitomaculum sp.]